MGLFKRFRSAVTGRFVGKKDATAAPRETVGEEAWSNGFPKEDVAVPTPKVSPSRSPRDDFYGYNRVQSVQNAARQLHERYVALPYGHNQRDLEKAVEEFFEEIGFLSTDYRAAGKRG